MSGKYEVELETEGFVFRGESLMHAVPILRGCHVDTRCREICDRIQGLVLFDCGLGIFILDLGSGTNLAALTVDLHFDHSRRPTYSECLCVTLLWYLCAYRTSYKNILGRFRGVWTIKRASGFRKLHLHSREGGNTYVDI